MLAHGTPSVVRRRIPSPGELGGVPSSARVTLDAAGGGPATVSGPTPAGTFAYTVHTRAGAAGVAGLDGS